jgi:hypothetical protein
MTPGSPLTPHAALGWLRSLSIDLLELAILDAEGAVLAGDAALARGADAALARGADAPLAQGADATLARGSDAALAQGEGAGNERLIVARSGQHAIVVRPGPKALERLVRADLQAALEALKPR